MNDTRTDRLSHFRIGNVLLGLAILWGSAAVACAAAGLALTSKDRLTGELVVKEGALNVAGKAVAWDDVVVAINDATTERQPGLNALELKSGEVWAGRIESLRDGVVAMESPVLGKCTVKVGEVRALNFQPGLPLAVQPETNVLHRLRGKPSPGAVLWIDATRIAAETALGALTFERDKIERFVLDVGPDASAAPAGAYDAVALADGSILHGTVRLQGDALVLNHAVAGEKTFADNAWVSVRRHSPAVIHLADTAPASVQTFPLIRRPPDPPRVEHGPDSRSDGDSPAFVRRVHIWPKTVMTYRPGAGAGEFRSTVSLEPRSRGPASVRFRVGEKTVFEHVLTPTNGTPVSVTFRFDKDAELGVEVDFGNVVRFPCGVVMDDPFVVLTK